MNLVRSVWLENAFGGLGEKYCLVWRGECNMLLAWLVTSFEVEVAASQMTKYYTVQQACPDDFDLAYVPHYAPE